MENLAPVLRLPRRPRSCFVCVHAEVGMSTWCEIYGWVNDETLDAADCPLFADDPDKS